MVDRADAHIHLFRHGFQDKFTARPGVHIDELACFASLAKEHHVTAALVVCYAAEAYCRDNNEFLAEKIKGFIADHDAEIVNIEENYVLLSIDGQQVARRRRRTDRPSTLIIELRLNEEARRASNERRVGTRTYVQVKIRPKRQRDRRDRCQTQADQILASLKSYLIAQECTPNA